MYKLIGAVMVLGSCLAISIKQVRRIRRKNENINQMRRALFFLKNEICFSAKELWATSEELSLLLKGDAAAFFERISERLKADETLSFGAAWDMEMDHTMLPQETMRYLSEFAARTGTLPREAETEHIAQAEQVLGQMLKEAQTRFAEQRKMIVSLGALSGAAMLVLFL